MRECKYCGTKTKIQTTKNCQICGNKLDILLTSKTFNFKGDLIKKMDGQADFLSRIEDKRKPKIIVKTVNQLQTDLAKYKKQLAKAVNKAHREYYYDKINDLGNEIMRSKGEMEKCKRKAVKSVSR